MNIVKWYGNRYDEDFARIENCPIDMDVAIRKLEKQFDKKSKKSVVWARHIELNGCSIYFMGLKGGTNIDVFFNPDISSRECDDLVNEILGGLFRTKTELVAAML